MNSTQVLLAIRHALTIAGTIAVTLGYTDAAHCTAATNTLIQVIGGVLVALNFIWGLYNAAKNHQLKQWWDSLAPSEQMAIVAEVRRQNTSRINRGFGAMLLLALFASAALTGCAVVPGNILSVTDSAIGMKITGSPQGTSTLPIEVELGIIRTTYHVVPTATNSATAKAPNVTSSMTFSQHGFSTDIAEDFATGDAAMNPPNTNSVAAIAAKSIRRAPVAK